VKYKISTTKTNRKMGVIRDAPKKLRNEPKKKKKRVKKHWASIHKED
jgi:hypothetical protein